MLSDDQHSEFARSGLFRLTDIFTAPVAEQMCQRVWDWLAHERRIRADDRATWPETQITGLQSLTRAGVFAALGSAMLTTIADELLGPDAWMRPRHWGAPLISFPTSESAWDVPGSQWHLDFPARGNGAPLFAVRVLACMAAVDQRCGGTLALAGSHRLVARLAAEGALGDGSSAAVRDALARRHPWLRDLFTGGGDNDRVRRFMVEGTVIDDVPLRVVELTGPPGHGFVMHPWQFHAAAPNCGGVPRLMVAHSLVRKDWAVENYRPSNAP